MKFSQQTNSESLLLSISAFFNSYASRRPDLIFDRPAGRHNNKTNKPHYIPNDPIKIPRSHPSTSRNFPTNSEVYRLTRRPDAYILLYLRFPIFSRLCFSATSIRVCLIAARIVPLMKSLSFRNLAGGS